VPGSCYERLRADVLAGRFEPGGVLLETVLARRYGVSRTPVREALGRLDQDGLLRRAARGYQVRSGTPEDVLEIYEARIALDSAAAFGAARRRTDLDLARLRHLHDAAYSSRDPDVIRDLNAQWHVALWRAAHNRTIESLLTSLTAQLRIYDRAPGDGSAPAGAAPAGAAAPAVPGPASSPDSPVFVDPGASDDLARTRAEHAQVLAAIIAQDAGLARDALAAHLARSRDLRLAAFARGAPGASD
jgi:DNA-binding GntR family transcriptional regulator